MYPPLGSGGLPQALLGPEESIRKIDEVDFYDLWHRLSQVDFIDLSSTLILSRQTRNRRTPGSRRAKNLTPQVLPFGATYPSSETTETDPASRARLGPDDLFRQIWPLRYRAPPSRRRWWIPSPTGPDRRFTRRSGGETRVPQGPNWSIWDRVPKLTNLGRQNLRRKGIPVNTPSRRRFWYPKVAVFRRLLGLRVYAVKGVNRDTPYDVASRYQKSPKRAIFGRLFHTFGLKVWESRPPSHQLESTP